MKRLIQFKFFLLTIAALSLLHACQKEDGLSTSLNPGSSDSTNLKRASLRIMYGPTREFGEGSGRAWISVDRKGNPVSVGLDLSEQALKDLPSDPVALVFPFPSHAGMNFYTHILLDWNPQGHVPAGIYDVPHFDVHFYTVSNEKRMNIPRLNPPAMDVAPAPEFVPPMYLQTPGLEPAMGAHWIDLLSPEFHGGTFTSTFVWGSYQGQFIFWEPMVTLAYLSSHPNDVKHLRQPLNYKREGWYAQDYQVSYSADDQKFIIALLNLEHHENR